MKTINYLMMLLFLQSIFLYASEKNKETSKAVTFHHEVAEPLLHMARSVSSEGPPLEGALRLKKMTTPVVAIEEEPDVEIEDSVKKSWTARTSRTFNFDAPAAGGAPSHALPRPSPRNAGAGAVLKSPTNVVLSAAAMRSPRSAGSGASSRRNSRDSSPDDDAATKEFITRRCDIAAGKNTPNTYKKQRKIVKEQKAMSERLLASGSIQSIDGDEITGGHGVDVAVLVAGDRGGSIASGGDVARDEWLPQQPGDLTPDTRAYYRKLKPAVQQTEKTLRFALSGTIEDPVQLDRTVKEKARQALAPLYHAHHRTRSGTQPISLSVTQDQRFAYEIEQSLSIGCCCSSSCCVIL